MYTKEAVGAFHVVRRPAAVHALWPLTLAMGAVACWRSATATLPRWYGVFSGFLCAATMLMAFAPGLPYFAVLFGPIWIVASAIVVLRHRNRPVGVAV